MKIGILGCGVMAETFADTLRQMGAYVHARVNSGSTLSVKNVAC